MQNLKYPEFDYNTWLDAYLCTVLKYRHTLILPDELLEIKELHAAQIHDASFGEYWCQTCAYAEWLLNFDIFMHIIMTDNFNLDEITTHVGEYYSLSKEQSENAAKELITNLNIKIA